MLPWPGETDSQLFGRLQAHHELELGLRPVDLDGRSEQELEKLSEICHGQVGRLNGLEDALRRVERLRDALVAAGSPLAIHQARQLSAAAIAAQRQLQARWFVPLVLPKDED